MPAIKEQVMKESLYLNDKSFPVIGAPKEKIPFDEMIGERIPGKLSRKRSNNSLERKNSVTVIRVCLPAAANAFTCERGGSV